MSDKLTEYLIIKREECDCVYGYRQDWGGREYVCDCVDHKRETQVDADVWLLERLGQLRYSESLDDYIIANRRIENPRFEALEGNDE